MPTWRRRRLNRQERFVMAYCRHTDGTPVRVATLASVWNMQPRVTRPLASKTEVRGWIRSAQLKGAPIATTAHGVIIARGAAIYRQAIRMKIHAIGELRNAATLLGTRLNDRLIGQLDSMGRRGGTVNTVAYAVRYGVKLRRRGRLTPIGNRIDRYLTKHRMTWKEFCARAGISKPTLVSVMNGKRRCCQSRTMAGIKRALEEP